MSTSKHPHSRLVYIALGSNLDNPIAQVEAGIQHWRLVKDCGVVKVSSLYQTPPWGVTDQPDFINAVISLRTALSAADLLATCKEIEQRQQRQKTFRWGPRTLDCDIIHITGEVHQNDNLSLPHPRWHERAFVVLPLLEIADDLAIADQSVVDAEQALSSADKSAIRRLPRSSSSSSESATPL